MEHDYSKAPLGIGEGRSDDDTPVLKPTSSDFDDFMGDLNGSGSDTKQRDDGREHTPPEHAPRNGPMEVVFNEEIREHIQAISSICERTGISFIAQFQLDTHPEVTEFACAIGLHLDADDKMKMLALLVTK